MAKYLISVARDISENACIEISSHTINAARKIAMSFTSLEIEHLVTQQSAHWVVNECSIEEAKPHVCWVAKIIEGEPSVTRTKEEFKGRRAAIQARYENELKQLEEEVDDFFTTRPRKTLAAKQIATPS